MISQRHSRSFVELSGDGTQLCLTLYRQIRAFWEALSQQAVCVFVCAALPEPAIRSPSHWPGMEGSSTSAGLSRIEIASLNRPMPLRFKAACREPLLRLTSRLIVQAERFKVQAIERKDNCPIRPREISSRSVSVSAKRNLIRSGGRMPPVRASSG
jgi:hypothetical protein